MGKTLIRVDCVDQRLYISTAPMLASGGRNEDEIEFGFCSLWDGFEKTAVFYREKDDVYHAIITDDRCIIPHEVLTDEGWMYFGVLGVKGDITRTSAIMRYRIEAGAITEGTKPSDPTPDIYAQYIARIQAIEQMFTSKPFSVTGNPVEIDNYGSAPMHVKTTVAINQSGEGDPSSVNPRPISVVDRFILTHTGEGSENKHMSAPVGNMAEGTFDFSTGQMVTTMVWQEFDGSADENISKYEKENLPYGFRFECKFNLAANTKTRDQSRCNRAKYVVNLLPNFQRDTYSISSEGDRIVYMPPEAAGNTVDSFRAWLAENPLQIAYIPAEIITANRVPTPIYAFDGLNTISVNHGTLTVEGEKSLPAAVGGLSERVTELEEMGDVNGPWVAGVSSIEGKSGDLTLDDVGAASKKDVDRLSEEIADLKNEDVITMKGEIITFSTVAGKPVRINAETSETVKLIHAGKNLLPRPLDNIAETTKVGITGTPHEDGSITLKGEATGTATFFLMFSSFGTERVFPAGKYYMSAKYDGTLTTKNGGDPIYTSINCRLEKLTADGKYTAVIDEYLPFGASFELTEPTTLRAFSSVGMTSVVDAVAYYQIEAGEKPTDWEPPVRSVYEVTFPVDIEAIEGANTVYTENGLMLTATFDMGEKQQILDEAKAMLENRLAGATDFTTVKTLVFGDSISADYYGSYRKWVTALIDCGFFAQDKVTNSSVHATGFVARYNNETNDFVSRAAAIEEKDSYDLVVVFGGINDAIMDAPMGETGGDILTQFKPAVDYFFDYIINNFTQARIVVLSPLRMDGGETQAQYSDYIKQVAKSYSLPVLNLTDESGFCPSIDAFKNRWTFTGYNGSDGVTGDGVHPNEEYERRFLAPMIRAFLQSVM